MNSYVKAIPALLLLAACGPSNALQQEPISTPADKPESLFQSFAKQNQATAGSLTVIKNGRTITETFGTATNETEFRIASCSKVLTAAGIVKSASLGHLSLEATYYDYEPYLPYSQITLNNMLSHSAGWDYTQMTLSPLSFENLDLVKAAYGEISAHTLAEYYVNESLQFTPGSKQVYSSLAYVLLGGVLDDVEGNYETFIQDNVLSNSTMHVKTGNHEVEKYIPRTGLDPYQLDLDALKGTLGWVSTSEDFISTFLSLRNNPTYDEMWTIPAGINPPDNGDYDREVYSHGARVLELDHQRFYACEGTMTGTTAYAVISDDGKMGAMAILNTDADAAQLRDFINNQLLTVY